MSVKKDALSEAYQRNPTLRNYVYLRRNNPDIEICPKTLDLEEIYRTVLEVEEEFLDFDISLDVVVAAMDGETAAISELSLTLMELLIERDAMQKTQRTHLVSRGDVISDVLVNRLIAMMFEGVDKTGSFDINRDLITLINYQLTGPVARLHKQRESKLTIHDIRQAAIELGKTGANPSLRAIAERLGVNATTVLRSLPKADLQRIQAAHRPGPDRSIDAWAIITRYMPEGTMVAGDKFFHALEIVLANPDLPEAELLPMVEDALRGSGANVPHRVAPEV
jgi:hypothetical protein